MKNEWNWMLDKKPIGKPFPPKEVIEHLKSNKTDIHLEMRSWRKHLRNSRKINEPINRD